MDQIHENTPNFYIWTAIEDDGYEHSEMGVAMNMKDAFEHATEYAPSWHRYVEIRKLTAEEAIEKLGQERYDEFMSYYKEN